MESIMNIPSRKEIEGLKVGDSALNCFGRIARVVAIAARKEDIEGRLFVLYYTKLGSGSSSISMSQKEGRLTRTAYMSNRYTSAELDDLETSLINQANQTASYYYG